MLSPIAPLDLTLSDLERSKSSLFRYVGEWCAADFSY